MFHFGIHAQPIEIITHETNTSPGFSLGSDDYIYNMAAQNNMGRNTCNRSSLSHIERWYSI